MLPEFPTVSVLFLLVPNLKSATAIPACVTHVNIPLGRNSSHLIVWYEAVACVREVNVSQYGPTIVVSSQGRAGQGGEGTDACRTC